MRKMLILTMLCAALTVGACAATDKPVSSCLAWRPIYLDDADIRGLRRPAKEKIAAHNRTFETLCP